MKEEGWKAATKNEEKKGEKKGIKKKERLTDRLCCFRLYYSFTPFGLLKGVKLYFLFVGVEIVTNTLYRKVSRLILWY